MFELIPIEIFTDVLRDRLGMLSDRCIENIAPGLHEALSSRFDAAYEACFLIIDNDSGKPMTREVITDRKTADECARVCGPGVSVGILLIDR